MNEQSKEQITAAFEQALNNHGYGFQYKVLSNIQELCSKYKCKWWPYVSEFPVDIQGSGTRIDFILKHENKNYFILAECKRANPSHDNWCFANEPASNDYKSGQFFIEGLTQKDMHLHFLTKDMGPCERVYNIAVEGKTHKPGDNGGKNKGHIEDAVTQLCRGLNGIIEYFCKHHEVRNNLPIYFIPVLFTTAKLLVTNKKMDSANLDDGLLKIKEIDIGELNWLHYHYPQSPGLKHGISPLENKSDLREKIYYEYIRDITIVNPKGIEEFLCNKDWDLI